MLVYTAGLLGLFNPAHLFPPHGAGIAPCSVITFAYCVARGEPFCSLFFAVSRLMSLGIIAACLRGAALSADIAIIVAVEVLLHSTGLVIELVLVYVTIPCHSCIYDGIGYFWVRKFNYYRRYLFEGGFFS